MFDLIKRDGSIAVFDKNKIINAINKAFIEVDGQLYEDDTAKDIANEIEKKMQHYPNGSIGVEDIQDWVEDFLMQSYRRDVARAYIRFRYKKEMLRQSNTTDQSIKELLEGDNDYWNNENSNKNAKRTTVQRDYMAGIVSTDITRRFLLDKDIVEAHDEGIIHFHDADYFAQNALHNCELINLEDMLQNGTVVNGVMIEKPHKLLTATTIATQIIAAVTSSSYGGATISLTHLAPFVRSSKERYIEKYLNRGFNKEDSLKFAQEDLQKEIIDSVQTFNYQTNSMTNTNGQAPFLSVFMYLGETKEYKEELAMLIEEFLKQRILGFKNEKGIYITPAFPKLLYVLEEDNIKPDRKYWYLTEKAAECTAKRMVPDYISEKIMLKLKGDCYPCMGCRSFLTPDPENHKYYGRFNQGVVTINLADIAFSSKGNMKEFWKIFDERLELCHRALQARHERLSHANADVSPVLWRYGALARLNQGESIHKLLHNNYSTLSLGYAALYECVKYMTNESHTKDGKEFGLAVMRHLNDVCSKWRNEEDISYSVYGSPIESTTYKFASCLKKRFGDNIFIDLDGKDRNYITNSYHVPVFEEIDAFTKLALESEFQELSPGGAISYIETPNLQNNIEAVETVMQFIYEHIMYAELNTKSDYCQECGYNGEILIDDKMEWYCPNCGNRNHETLNVARRTCGYIGSQFWNYGRTNEIKDRVLHL
jgi:ribonucleoside-triphosphate reductase (formate)